MSRESLSRRQYFAFHPLRFHMGKVIFTCISIVGWVVESRLCCYAEMVQVC